MTAGKSFAKDLASGTVVFLVAVPLCLGIALASNAPLFSGLLAGIVGGTLVGMLTKSQTSVSGPAAGLTAVVAAQIASLGSFEAFLTAVVIAGLIQMALGLLRAGFISMFFPSSVIKGLLAAIGIIIILKQIPHLFGHDSDPEGEMSFFQPDQYNTFSEFFTLLAGDVHIGASVIGLVSLAVLLVWDKAAMLKRSFLPGPLVVVLLGVLMSYLFSRLGGDWLVGSSHLVQVPIAKSVPDFISFLQLPDFTVLSLPAVYVAGLTLALVASLETLLNLEAIDDLTPSQRRSPASRELIAQGAGNFVSGLIGGLPVTVVIVRSSLNIHAGAQSQLSTMVHGVLLLVSVVFFPQLLNSIPLSCLAAILIITGWKLATPELVRAMWQAGRYQFTPFVVTIIAIVLTDLMIGILIGLAVSISFILLNNVKRPLRLIQEKHLSGEVLRIELANQVSFLNRAVIEQVLDEVTPGSQVLIDANNTSYIDPDVLGMIREYRDKQAPARGVKLSLSGFRDRYNIKEEIQYIDYSTKELQKELTPERVLQYLREGNDRFRTGHCLTRRYERQVVATAHGQHPMAVVLSCMDSRAPAEIVFDLGIGDMFSVRVAGNVTSPKVLASMEYACAVANSPLVLVMGHTRCGAVAATMDYHCMPNSPLRSGDTGNLSHILKDITESIDDDAQRLYEKASPLERQAIIDRVTKANVLRSVASVFTGSKTLCGLASRRKIAVIGAIYDVSTGQINFLEQESDALTCQLMSAAT